MLLFPLLTSYILHDSVCVLLLHFIFPCFPIILNLNNHSRTFPINWMILCLFVIIKSQLLLHVGIIHRQRSRNHWNKQESLVTWTYLVQLWAMFQASSLCQKFFALKTSLNIIISVELEQFIYHEFLLMYTNII